MHRGGGKGGGLAWARHAEENGEGSGTGATHSEEGPGGAGDTGAEQGRDTPIGGPARKVGPRCRDREEGREGDRWARSFKFNPNSMIQTG
jgi:hypothetical protein